MLWLDKNTFLRGRIRISDVVSIWDTCNCWVTCHRGEIVDWTYNLKHILDILSRVKINKIFIKIIHLSSWTNNLYRFIELILMFKLINHHLWFLYHLVFLVIKPMRQNRCLICVLSNNIFLRSIFNNWLTLNINSQSTFISEFNVALMGKSVNRKVLS